MAVSVRLTNWHKSQILNALDAHRVGPREEALRLKQEFFALRVYQDLYSEKVRAQMACMPPGFLPETESFKVSFGGKVTQLNLAHPCRFADKHKRLVWFVYPAPHPFSEEHMSLEGESEELDALCSCVRAQAKAALDSVTTVKKLLQLWPEVAPFVPKAYLPACGPGPGSRRVRSRAQCSPSTPERRTAMKVIRARNVHRALPLAVDALLHEGYLSDSRNGSVLRFDGPVTTVYEKPCERVLFWKERNCNPFFHLYESLWMLAGRNDVDSVAALVPRMKTFSDDGKTLHGAYGHRWFSHFGFNQLSAIIDGLRANPQDRRMVLGMWDPRTDLGRNGKDFPCNLQTIFGINRDGAVDMEVTNRSNDIVWGAYGANAVHFSYLQEYVAARLDRPVGQYWQVSFNFHAYLTTLEPVKPLAGMIQTYAHVPGMLWETADPYTCVGGVVPYPLTMNDPVAWHHELDMFLTAPEAIGYTEPFFRRVAIPMHRAYLAFKNPAYGSARFDRARDVLSDCRAEDWRLAALEWLDRAEVRANRASDDGVHAAVAS